MEQIEGLFKEINRLKEKGHFSLDLYYNDLDDTFVVKIQNLFDPEGHNIKPQHFRNEHLIDSMLDAFNYLKLIFKT